MPLNERVHVLSAEAHELPPFHRSQAAVAGGLENAGGLDPEDLRDLVRREESILPVVSRCLLLHHEISLGTLARTIVDSSVFIIWETQRQPR